MLEPFSRHVLISRFLMHSDSLPVADFNTARPSSL